MSCGVIRRLTQDRLTASRTIRRRCFVLAISICSSAKFRSLIRKFVVSDSRRTLAYIICGTSRHPDLSWSNALVFESWHRYRPKKQVSKRCNLAIRRPKCSLSFLTTRDLVFHFSLVKSSLEGWSKRHFIWFSLPVCWPARCAVPRLRRFRQRMKTFRRSDAPAAVSARPSRTRVKSPAIARRMTVIVGTAFVTGRSLKMMSIWLLRSILTFGSS